MTATAAPEHDLEKVALALDTMTAGMEKMTAGLATLRQLLSPSSPASTDSNPKDPANKHEIGGMAKLTPRGVEVCYRLFDRGTSRYAVAQAMGISFGAANHRHSVWKNAGGVNRRKQPIS